MRFVVNENRWREPYDFALMHYAEREVSGQKDNPKIIKMFEDLGFDAMAITSLMGLQRSKGVFL